MSVSRLAVLSPGPWQQLGKPAQLHYGPRASCCRLNSQATHVRNTGQLIESASRFCLCKLYVTDVGTEDHERQTSSHT